MRIRPVLALLCVMSWTAGSALAQTSGGPLVCQIASASATPTLRGEGFAERTADITLTCTGGIAPAIGSAIPQFNLSIFYNTGVTNRLLPVPGVSNSISEALLLIDEPGSGLTPAVPGFGPAAGQNLCTTPLQGCLEYVSQTAGSTINVATDTAQGTSATTPGKNVFQGIVNGNAVTFFGVPALAPGNSGSRVFRITNVRVNANLLAGGSGSFTPVQASISISGAVSLLVSDPYPFVGFVAGSITASTAAAPSVSQCTSQTLTQAGTLSFAEKFGTAFKTRVMAQNNVLNAGQNSTPGLGGFAPQNVPGGVFQSESGLVMAVATGQTAGLSDFGTRLKAMFNNVPAGARVFVSVSNVLNNGLPVPVPAVIGGSAANTGTTGFAQLTSDEVAAFNAVTPTGSANSGSVPVAELAVVNGSATAVWEVINTNPNLTENLLFGVYVSYTALPAANSPSPGTAIVNLSYAASPPNFPAGSGSMASDTLPLPRFLPDPGAARDILTITPGSCSPHLSITKSHAGNFTQGQIGATYTLTVANAAAASATSGTVSVADTLPGGLIATAISGLGWNCSLVPLTCDRADSLAPGSLYSPITVTVNVVSNATSPQINQARVSGVGFTTATTSDSTIVTGAISAVSALPASGSGLSQTFALQYSDTAGVSSFSKVSVLFNATPAANPPSSCMVSYDLAANTLLLLNDAGTQSIPGTPGTVGILQNSACFVDLGSSSLGLAGNTLTLNLAMTFRLTYAGSKNVYLSASDTGGNSTGWQARGTWIVPSVSATVTADHVTPTSGSGTGQMFALQYTDTAGASSFATASVIFNETFAVNPPNSCTLSYDRAAGTLSLLNDAATLWMPATPGVAGTLQNSQCAVNLPTTSVVLSGNALTLNLPVTFKPAFAGAKNIFMSGSDAGGSSSGWQTLGGWAVPGVITGPGSITITCPIQSTAGADVACSLNLQPNLAAGIIDSLTLGLAVTPNGSAPALATGALGFSDPVRVQAATPNTINLSWSNVTFPFSNMALGSVGFVLPPSALPGQSYSVALTSVSASSGGIPVSVLIGLPPTISIPIPGQASCTTNVTVTPNLRGEGYTEQVGDITLTCQGGTVPALGAAIPQADITVNFNAPVTSRLLPVAGVSNATSEALLLIDEPGSGLPSPVPGFGPAAPQSLCPTPLQGCVDTFHRKPEAVSPWPPIRLREPLPPLPERMYSRVS